MLPEREYLYGIFSRQSQPENWGGHGYVTIIIRCWDEVELKATQEYLVMHDYYGIVSGASGGAYAAGDLGKWFGGRFDLTGVFRSVDDPINPQGDTVKYHCVGDNRFYGLYDAAEVLGEGELSENRGKEELEEFARRREALVVEATSDVKRISF